MLDQGNTTSGKYCVTNLGKSGATLQKAPKADAPYWKTNQFQTLIKNKWDIVVVMLGTNDAKDACGHPASFCRNTTCCNWPHPGKAMYTAGVCTAPLALHRRS
jgi:hypothetical protein